MIASPRPRLSPIAALMPANPTACVTGSSSDREPRCARPASRSGIEPSDDKLLLGATSRHSYEPAYWNGVIHGSARAPRAAGMVPPARRRAVDQRVDERSDHDQCLIKGPARR
jgi:hypothetical protein